MAIDIAADSPTETFLLYRIFDAPDKDGGRKAIAMSKQGGDIIIVLYTFLITAIFVTLWNILISLILLFGTPKKMSRTTYVAAIATWNSADPFTAAWVIVPHAARIFRGVVRKTHPIELTWAAFGFDMLIILVAAGIFVGNIIVGLWFPKMLLIGNVAPVKPDIVYYPDMNPLFSTGYYLTSRPKERRVIKEYDAFRAQRAFASVDHDASDLATQKKSEKKVNVTTEAAGLFNNTEPRYKINYSYTVRGLEMGLQDLDEISVKVSGNCTFFDNWYVGKVLEGDPPPAAEYDTYIMWPSDELVPDASNSDIFPYLNQTVLNATDGYTLNSYDLWSSLAVDGLTFAMFSVPIEYQSGQSPGNTSISYWAVVPVTAGRLSMSASSDPWYFTENITYPINGLDFEHMVKPGRPPLVCQQQDEWSSGSEKKGTLEELVKSMSSEEQERHQEFIKIVTLAFTYPMPVNLGNAVGYNALKSSTRVYTDILTGEIDAEVATAIEDMERIFQASYVATRDLFRHAALAGASVGKEFNKDVKNVLRKYDSKPIEGELLPYVGSFNMTNAKVSTLCLKYIILVPSLLALLFFLGAMFKFGRKVRGAAIISLYPNWGLWARWHRFKLFAIGFQITQLYRMVDQLLADRAADLDGDTAQAHKEQALWKAQTSAMPFVVDNQTIRKDTGPVLPEFHVLGEGDDRRVGLDVATYRKYLNPGGWESESGGDQRWRVLGPGDKSTTFAALKRQRRTEMRAMTGDLGAMAGEENKDTSVPTARPWDVDSLLDGNRGNA